MNNTELQLLLKKSGVPSEISDDKIVLKGKVRSYFLKQKAQEIVKKLIARKGLTFKLDNQLQVVQE